MQNTFIDKISSRVLILILVILSLAGLILSACSLVSASEDNLNMGNDIASVVMYLLVLFYAVSGYREPHGNIMRCCFFLFAVADAVFVISAVTAESVSLVQLSADLLAIILSAYMSGRLNRFDQNRYILLLVAILLAVRAVSGACAQPSLTILGRILPYSPFLLWLCLSIAYAIRFKEHKDAGAKER